MLKPVPDKPRRNFVKKAARTFMLDSKQDELPIDVDSLFEDNGWLLMPAETAEQQVGMSIPIEFWQNDSAEALTCYYADKFITLYKTQGRIPQKIRFTKAHELGHIVLNHLTDYEQPDSFSIERSSEYHTLEREAEMFAAEVLAPTPVLRDIDLFEAQYIQTVCDISESAADITVSDINLDLNVSEADKNAVLRKFHKFIYSASYLKRVRKNTCPLCGVALSGNENHCQICGEKIHRSLYDHPKLYGSPPQTHNGRLLYCPKCKNAVFRGGRVECPNCGQSLYNKCTNPEHKWLLPGFARYCPYCGEVTTYYSSGVITEWQVDNYNADIEQDLFNKHIDGVPVSVDWHFWVHRILPKENVNLYVALKDSVATVEYGDLVVYANIDELPEAYIRESMLRYCGMDVISINIENGGFMYDV